MSRLTSTAVMNRRALGPESLDYFPTPPWATRAMLHEVLIPRFGGSLQKQMCLEPCCGEGHMVGPLREVFGFVAASDVHDYGQLYPVADVLDRSEPLSPANWVITNPPFPAAAQIADRVLDSPSGPHSLALLCRLNWAEGKDRYRDIFRRRRPTLIAISADRIPMIEGAYDPEADTATAYAWFIWDGCAARGMTETTWIAPDADRRWFRPEDLQLAKPGEAARRKAERKAAAAAAAGVVTETTPDLFGGEG